MKQTHMSRAAHPRRMIVLRTDNINRPQKGHRSSAPTVHRSSAPKGHRSSAPTGHNVIAQGNALGKRPHKTPRPKGAECPSHAPNDAPVFRPQKGHRSSAPTGHNVIAQGNALGKRPHKTPRPEGAECPSHAPTPNPFHTNQTSSPSVNNINAYRANPHTAPSGLAYLFRFLTQGVALGFRLSPRWG